MTKFLTLQRQPYALRKLYSLMAGLALSMSWAASAQAALTPNTPTPWVQGSFNVNVSTTRTPNLFCSSLNCATINSPWNLTDGDLNNYASINLPSSSWSAPNGEISVKEYGTIYPSNTYVGFKIARVGSAVDAAYLNGITVSTYQGGVLRQTLQGSSLLGNANSSIGAYQTFNVGFLANATFDEVRIRVSPPQSYSLWNPIQFYRETYIYNAYLEQISAGPAPSCNSSQGTNWVRPTYPVVLNASRTALNASCTNCTLDNTASLLDSDPNNYTTSRISSGSASVSVYNSVATTYASGSFAGFTVEDGSNLGNAFTNTLQVTTYLNGTVQESASGANLIDAGSGTRRLVGLNTTKPFTEVQITTTPYANQLTTAKIYNAVLAPQSCVAQPNRAPVISSDGAGSTAAINMPENQTAVTTVAAGDADYDGLTYSIEGGADAAKFAISGTGSLSFKAAPNYEAPTDVGANNVYDVMVKVSDGRGGVDTQALAISVTNVDEFVCLPLPVNVVGNASVLPSSEMQLTPAVNSQLGALWGVNKVSLNLPFDYTAGVYLGNKDGGADGLTFTLQNTSNTVLGRAGRGMGVSDSETGAGISPSLMIELDTYRNADMGWYDPAYDHLAVYLNGNGRHNSTSTNLVNPVDLGNIEDGAYHKFRVVWTPSSSTLQVYFDGVLRATKVVNLVSALGSTTAYWGYSASTGALNNQHKICNETDPTVPFNNIPVITSNGGGDTAAISLNENLTSATTVMATDADNDVLSYSVVGGTDAAQFTINPVTGVLNFINKPDYEAPADSNGDNLYQVTVQASDSKGGIDTQILYISILNDTNEINHPPVIISDGGGDIAALTVADGDISVTKVEAIDQDKDTITYSISGGADKAMFVIDPNTGILTFKTPAHYGSGISGESFDPPMDANGDNIYEVVVMANDGRSGSDTQTINVTVVPAGTAVDNSSDIIDLINIILNINVDSTINSNVSIKARVLLQGPFDTSTGLMRDDLRLKGLIPASQPYTSRAMGLYAGTETLSPTVMAMTNNNAVVDWVMLELRHSSNPAVIVGRAAAVVQRDGDIVDPTTGANAVKINYLTPGNYYVSIRHRNHLGIMSATPISFTAGVSPSMDFTLSSTPMFGTASRLEVGSQALMWSGALANSINLTGQVNAPNLVLGTVLNPAKNKKLNSNYKLDSYILTDYNMDGLVIFNGVNNDLNTLMGNVYLYPLNTQLSADYEVPSALPN